MNDMQHITHDARIVAECLKAYREYRRRRAAAAGDAPWEAVPITEYVPPTPAEIVARIIEEPIYHALRGKVREIGLRIYAEGDLEAMQAIEEQVEDLGVNTYVLDRWWDGIGPWMA